MIAPGIEAAVIAWSMAASSLWATPPSMSWAASALVVPGVAGADDSDDVEPLPHPDAEMSSATAATP
ncbi:MAG: hypothetical protein WBV51_15125 [Pseudolabrys sp.]